MNNKKGGAGAKIILVLILMLASSLCMYSVEHQAQPDKFANALSGMWWSVSALLTVVFLARRDRIKSKHEKSINE